MAGYLATVVGGTIGWLGAYFAFWQAIEPWTRKLAFCAMAGDPCPSVERSYTSLLYAGVLAIGIVATMTAVVAVGVIEADGPMRTGLVAAPMLVYGTWFWVGFVGPWLGSWGAGANLVAVGLIAAALMFSRWLAIRWKDWRAPMPAA